MQKKNIGIFRSSFPLYSETFICEQIKAYSTYAPIVVCRKYFHDGVEREVVKISSPFALIKNLLFALAPRKLFLDKPNLFSKIHLLHAHFGPDATFAMSLAHESRMPFVVTFHGSDVLVEDRFLWKSKKIYNYRYLLLREKLIEKSSLFIAVSDFLRNAMIARGFPAEKTVTSYIGVDVDQFTPAPRRLMDEASEGYIVSVARHTNVKGIDVLLRAFALVVKVWPALKLVQIGGGPLTGELKALAQELGVASSVVFLGPKPSSEVLAYIQNSLALVLSSRKSHDGAEEAFGLVLNEASACGIPCIGTQVGGIPEGIVHGETGLVVPSEDPAALADAINTVVGGPALAAEMGRKGRVLVCEKFNLRKQTKKLESLYEAYI